MSLSNIEAERGRFGLSKEAISRELGITSTTYRSYISGGAIPSDILLKMSEIFKCSVDYLLGVAVPPNVHAKTDTHPQ